MPDKNITAAICPNCGKPVETHAMFDPPRCPVVRLRWPLDVAEPGAVTSSAVACGHPNHGNADHDCTAFLGSSEWRLIVSWKVPETGLTAPYAYGPYESEADARLDSALCAERGGTDIRIERGSVEWPVYPPWLDQGGGIYDREA